MTTRHDRTYRWIGSVGLVPLLADSFEGILSVYWQIPPCHGLLPNYINHHCGPHRAFISLLKPWQMEN